MNWAVIARVLLRYVAGAGIFGSLAFGEELAADPDLVLAISVAIAGVVEAFYVYAKKRGWAT
jgi:preprotein translocase subunit Sec61beta